MSKDEVEQLLAQSSEMPLFTNSLQDIVEQAYALSVNYTTKCMVYDLVGIILLMGERIHELELRGTHHVLWDDASKLYRADHPIDKDKEAK